MAKEKKKLPLAAYIFAGLVLGILAGAALMKTPEIAVEYIKPFGTLFLNLVKFIVVPIVLFSIMSGVISMQDMRKVGSIGVKTVCYYMCTTAMAVLIGLVIANLCKGFFHQLATSGLEYEAAEAPSFIETIVNIFPNNALEPMVNANMLQVIVIALFFGFGAIAVGEKGRAFTGICRERKCDFHVCNGCNHQAEPDWRFLLDYTCGSGKRPLCIGGFGNGASGGVCGVYSAHGGCVFADGEGDGRTEPDSVL